MQKISRRYGRFSEEHLRAAGIKKRYYNDDQKRCLDEIIEDIRYGKFKDVVGHRDVIQYLQNAVAENRVSQAYIVNGERGTGKKMLAKLFAMALLCEEHGPEPCNKCHSCVQAESNNHPDIIWVTHEKPTRFVDDVRTQINKTVCDIKPYQVRTKIILSMKLKK